MGLFTYISAQTDSFFNLLKISAGTALAQQIAVFFSAYLTITVMIKGYETMAGLSQSPVTELAWDFGKKAIIITFALNYAGWLDMVIEALNGLHHWSAGGTSTYENLDKVFENIKKIADLAYDKAGSGITAAIIGGLAEIIIYLSFLVGCALPAFVILLLTTFTLKIMLMLTPIIIGCLFFGWLKNVFTQGLNIFLSNLFTVLIITILLNTLDNFILKFIELSTDNLKNGMDSLYVSFKIFTFSAVFFVIIKTAASIAKELAVTSIESIASSGIKGTGKDITNGVKGAKATAKGIGATASGTRNVYSNTRGWLQNYNASGVRRRTMGI